ncbi:uncharacterized protein FIBRA_09225 [Fibroporia radiculosa]|uniref:Epoxide hydrolase N-terminal domain-containing protein n=1 Tax=Fibroporia radiculosa TaxID=599839 RepID=J7SCU4_9APHY|nr:uncharacterized protein FIBRA_09225 [Fibroporia radiculosa]CCM06913.1 predicted protein [Fibroporia radiculosa]
MSTETPFTIAIPDADIDLLRKKLELVRLPDELDDANWDYGVPLKDVRRLVARWKDGYEWRKTEADLNKLPQFTRDIGVDGFGVLNIHYIHQKSTVEGAVPLLFVHGWPGNFLEVTKLLPLLTAASPDHPSFHVVALSLPGYGFSEAPKKKGFAALQYAEVAHKLMLALGYSEYVAQGGDWGYLICKTLTMQYGHKHVKAWHTNSPFTGPPAFLSDPFRFLAFVGSLVMPWSARDKEGMARTTWFQEKGSGYYKEQSTQPQTLGYSLADSPVGLLAWIYEKLVNWTDSYPWEDDEVLTWISIYWFSRAGPAASVRIYYEVTKGGKEGFGSGAVWNSVPMGVSFFPKELAIVPKLWVRGMGKVVFESDHEAGGHFAAYERPVDLVSAVRRMFGKNGPAHGIVPGKNGLFQRRMMTTETPFRISVLDADIELLHKKLELVHLPDELDEAGWEYGAPLEDVRRLIARWKDGYDWRKAEVELNELPQFTRDIEVDGFGALNVHYIHQKSTVEGAVPLLFVHGWPGNFLEMTKILPLLTAASPDHPSFHVVALSLPGYGFSETPKKKGFALEQYAEVANKLMLALDYPEYVTQGGDWGYFITRVMASQYGHKHVKAWHTNSPFTGPPSFFTDPIRFFGFLGSLVIPWSVRDKEGIARTMQFEQKGTGYFQEQTTQPQTLGYSLSDTPVGLLAWIYEKLVTWTDRYPWEDDEVLTWISIYWFSRAGPAASIRLYYEATRGRNGYVMVGMPWSSVPMGASFFPKELGIVPKLWVRGIGNIVFESDHDSGGHFAAYEKPTELVADLRKMFGKDGPAHAVIPGKNGYT